jgi:hypothetical protein
MSIYVPHIDASYTFEYVAQQFENVFEIGSVERIEAVPRVNQKDGHAYYAYFIYFSKWGNGYNAQYLRNQLMEGKQTCMYYLIDRYWKVCPNTSEVANLPMPEHATLIMYVPKVYCYENDVMIREISQMMELFEFGEVSPYSIQLLEDDTSGSEDYAGFAEDIIGEEYVNEYRPVVVNFTYWYHSKNAHQVQYELETEGHIVICPNIPEYPDMSWLVMKYYDSNTKSGINPYIWYSDSSKYQTQYKHMYLD